MALHDASLAGILGGTTLLFASFCLALWSSARRQQRALRAVARAGKEVAKGETHVFAPLMPGVAGDLARVINGLADVIRVDKLGAHPERAFEQAMVRETPNGLVVVDGAGRIRTMNPAARKLLPWRGDPVGQLAAEVVPVPEFMEVLEEAAGTRAVSERGARAGARELLLRGLPLADGGGTMGVILDITSVRVAERARTDFVANVSHELRTPITTLVGYSEALLDEDLPPHTRPMVEAIARNAKRLHRLAEDVLQLSKIEARGADLPTERDVLLPIVEDVVGRLSANATAREITLSVSCSHAMEAMINADAFEHALANLVDNAVKYTPGGGHVRVVVTTSGTFVDVSVVDNGVGIDSAHHARIFERFYRVDAGRSRDAGGTGLGLSLVKHLCIAMGAEVFFTSAPGKGSAFTLRLPA